MSIIFKSNHLNKTFDELAIFRGVSSLGYHTLRQFWEQRSLCSYRQW